MAGRGVDRPPYPAALRLQAIAAERWGEIDGAAAAQGVDPFLLRPDRFCNLIYWWATQRVEDRREFDALLLDPLPRAARRARPKPTSDEGAGFMEFMSQVTAG